MQVESSEYSAWPVLPSPPVLTAGEVHVIQLPIIEQDESDRALLSVDERARLERFRNTGAARTFFAGRVGLRRILGRYAQCPPQDLVFCYTESGKPELAGPDCARNLQFNLSHTEQLGLVVVGMDDPVGVDLEPLGRTLDWEPIAKRYLAEQEYEDICAFPAENRLRAFLEIWVQRESLAKASGLGLAKILGQLRSDGPKESNQINAVWVTSFVDIGPQYRACITTRGSRITKSYKFRGD